MKLLQGLFRPKGVMQEAYRVDHNAAERRGPRLTEVTPAIETYLAIYGPHLKGFPLHKQLIDAQASYSTKTMTSECYRLYAGTGTPPATVLVRDDMAGGAAIEIEIYRLQTGDLLGCINILSANTFLGEIELANGLHVPGRFATVREVKGLKEITEFGGWKKYLSATYCLYFTYKNRT